MSDRSIIELEDIDIELNHFTDEFTIFKKYNEEPLKITVNVYYRVLRDMFIKIKRLENSLNDKRKEIKFLKDKINHLKTFK